MVERTISHYEILEKLGEGGMGVVYKARDTHLDRFVAIKVLPPEKVADAERKRRFGGDGEEVHPRLWTEPNQEPRTGSKNYLENNQGFATKNLPQGPNQYRRHLFATITEAYRPARDGFGRRRLDRTSQRWSRRSRTSMNRAGFLFAQSLLESLLSVGDKLLVSIRVDKNTGTILPIALQFGEHVEVPAMGS
jgi:hypothetical protein